MYNHATKSWEAIEVLYSEKRAPIVQTLHGPVQAETPFIKGIAPLYRLQTEAGLSFLGTADHRVLTQDGWKFLSGVSRNDFVGIPVDLESFQLTSLEDDRRWKHKAQDYLEHYSGGSHLYDLQPLWQSDIVQDAAPSQNGAHEFDCADFDVGAQTSKEARNHLYQFDARPSMSDYSPQLVGTLKTQSASSEEIAGELFDWYQLGDKYQTGIFPPVTTEESHTHTDNTQRALVGRAAVCCSSSTKLELVERMLPPSQQAHLYMGTAHKNPELLVSDLPLDVCIHAYSTSNLDYKVQWTQVSSIAYERTDVYYDLHVPKEEHYLSEGIYSHNTGKSRASLEKLYWAARKYPGMRGAIVRKYRSTITQTALITFDQLVRVPGDGVVFNSVDQEYNFENGSQIVIAGLDDPGKILSTEFDIIYVQECTQIDENTWETLTTRLRWNHMPYQQLLGDCNPDASRHWIKKREASGRLTLLESLHADNPMLWDEKENTWTPFGENYIETLKNLSGTVRQRLYEGKWVGAEGVIYTNFDPKIHIIEPMKIPKHWDRYLAIDFGYNNPFVCQWWAIDHDGNMYMYRELYGVQRTVEDWGHEIAEQSRGEIIKFAICDHDAEDQATLRRHATHTEEECLRKQEKPRSLVSAPSKTFRTVGADKERSSITAGIETVQTRLKLGPNGKPRIFFFRTALVEPDPNLINAKKPTSTLEEFDEYIWDEVQSGRLGHRILEQPRKLFDHGMDAMRYFVRYIDNRQNPGSRPNIFGQKAAYGYGNTAKTPDDIIKSKLKDNFWK